MLRAVERHRHLLDFALASLWRRKGKNAALIAVYTLVVFLLGSTLFFTHGIKREAARLLAEAPEIVVQRSVMGRYEPVPAAWTEQVRALRGVSEVQPRLWGYYFDPVLKANYTFVADRRAEPGKLLLGAALSRARGAYPGDTISFDASDGAYTSFEVKGVLSEASELLSADLILISEDDYRRLSGAPAGFVTDLAVRVPNAKEVPAVAEKIAGLFPHARPILRSEILRTYDSLFDWRGGMMLAVLSATVLAFLILAWDKATALSAEERREIGILKAVGWDTGDIMLMKFWEGGSVSLFAFGAGSLLAYWHVFAGNGFVITAALKGWSTLYPNFRIAPYLGPEQLITLFFLTVVPYTAATIVPAWRAATVDPDQVMR